MFRGAPTAALPPPPIFTPPAEATCIERSVLARMEGRRSALGTHVLSQGIMPLPHAWMHAPAAQTAPCYVMFADKGCLRCAHAILRQCVVCGRAGLNGGMAAIQLFLVSVSDDPDAPAFAAGTAANAATTCGNSRTAGRHLQTSIGGAASGAQNALDAVRTTGFDEHQLQILPRICCAQCTVEHSLHTVAQAEVAAAADAPHDEVPPQYAFELHPPDLYAIGSEIIADAYRTHDDATDRGAVDTARSVCEHIDAAVDECVRSATHRCAYCSTDIDALLARVDTPSDTEAYERAARIGNVAHAAARTAAAALADWHEWSSRPLHKFVVATAAAAAAAATTGSDIAVFAPYRLAENLAAAHLVANVRHGCPSCTTGAPPGVPIARAVLAPRGGRAQAAIVRHCHLFDTFAHVVYALPPAGADDRVQSAAAAAAAAAAGSDDTDASCGADLSMARLVPNEMLYCSTNCRVGFENALAHADELRSHATHQHVAADDVGGGDTSCCDTAAAAAAAVDTGAPAYNLVEHTEILATPTMAHLQHCYIAALGHSLRTEHTAALFVRAAADRCAHRSTTATGAALAKRRTSLRVPPLHRDALNHMRASARVFFIA